MTRARPATLPPVQYGAMVLMDTPVFTAADCDFRNAYSLLDGGAVGVQYTKSLAGCKATFLRCSFDNTTSERVRRPAAAVPPGKIRPSSAPV